jgi:hypothetical protein
MWTTQTNCGTLTDTLPHLDLLCVCSMHWSGDPARGHVWWLAGWVGWQAVRSIQHVLCPTFRLPRSHIKVRVLHHDNVCITVRNTRVACGRMFSPKTCPYYAGLFTAVCDMTAFGCLCMGARFKKKQPFLERSSLCLILLQRHCNLMMWCFSMSVKLTGRLLCGWL